MLELIGQNLPTILAIAGAVAVAFLTPFGSKAIDRLFSRKPIFVVHSPVIDSDLVLTVEPANAVAKRRQPLGVCVRGVNIPNAGKIDKTDPLRWTVDLSHVLELQRY